MKKRVISLFMAITLCVSFLPAGAFADEDAPVDETAPAAELSAPADIEAPPAEDPDISLPAGDAVSAPEDTAEEPEEMPVETEAPPAEAPADEPEELPDEEPEDFADITPEPETIEAVGASSGTCGDNLTWTLDDSGTLTISGTGAMYDYPCITSNGGYAIPPRPTAPWPTSITTLVILDGVTSIGNDAFYNCSRLTSVTIASGVTSIGNYAFYNCYSLTSVTIGSGVTSIGYDAFGCCSSLTSVHVADIAAWCSISFSGSYGNPLRYARNLYLNGDLITELVIPDSVTSIGNSAFWGCYSLTSVTIGSGVTSIGNYAFYGCDSLTSVTIGSGVTSIGNYTFYGCTGLTAIYFNGDAPDIGSNSFGDVTAVAFYRPECSWPSSRRGHYGGSLRWIPLYTGHCGDDLTWSYSDGTLTISGTGAMDDYINPLNTPWYNYQSSVRMLVLPEGLTSIGDCAFSGCTGLTSVIIPNSVSSIGNWAFWDCYSLTSVTIGSGVTSIGEGAFWGCDALSDITVLNMDVSIEGERTLGTPGITTVHALVGSSAERYAQTYGYTFAPITICQTHTWSEWKTTAPSCTAMGSSVRTCQVCGFKETQYTPMLPCTEP